MQAYSETAIRKSFINCTKGASQRINIPKEVLNSEWENQIFLSWTDPKAPQSAYIVAETSQGLQGLVMERKKSPAKGGARMCQFCLTLHSSSGVSMMSIPTAKSSQENYGSIGTYICTDLDCADYVWGKKKPEGIRQMEESLSLEEKINRTLSHVQGLIERLAESLKK
ncbi:FBP domain-containing protein [uncultured Rothia sp.]|uniref:FBP domain-containing protein n=1 Tax=uncultured Rothia sp. TaxID=316088 RepID=UPI003216E1FC